MAAPFDDSAEHIATSNETQEPGAPTESGKNHRPESVLTNADHCSVEDHRTSIESSASTSNVATQEVTIRGHRSMIFFYYRLDSLRPRRAGLDLSQTRSAITARRAINRRDRPTHHDPANSLHSRRRLIGLGRSENTSFVAPQEPIIHGIQPQSPSYHNPYVPRPGTAGFAISQIRRGRSTTSQYSSPYSPHRQAGLDLSENGSPITTSDATSHGDRPTTPSNEGQNSPPRQDAVSPPPSQLRAEYDLTIESSRNGSSQRTRKANKRGTRTKTPPHRSSRSPHRQEAAPPDTARSGADYDTSVDPSDNRSAITTNDATIHSVRPTNPPDESANSPRRQESVGPSSAQLRADYDTGIDLSRNKSFQRTRRAIIRGTRPKTPPYKSPYSSARQETISPSPAKLRIDHRRLRADYDTGIDLRRNKSFQGVRKAILRKTRPKTPPYKSPYSPRPQPAFTEIDTPHLPVPQSPLWQLRPGVNSPPFDLGLPWWDLFPSPAVANNDTPHLSAPEDTQWQPHPGPNSPPFDPGPPWDFGLLPEPTQAVIEDTTLRLPTSESPSGQDPLNPNSAPLNLGPPLDLGLIPAGTPAVVGNDTSHPPADESTPWYFRPTPDNLPMDLNPSLDDLLSFGRRPLPAHISAAVEDTDPHLPAVEGTTSHLPDPESTPWYFRPIPDSLSSDLDLSWDGLLDHGHLPAGTPAVIEDTTTHPPFPNTTPHLPTPESTPGQNNPTRNSHQPPPPPTPLHPGHPPAATPIDPASVNDLNRWCQLGGHTNQNLDLWLTDSERRCNRATARFRNWMTRNGVDPSGHGV